MTHVFMFAGELSGDSCGGMLLHHLKLLVKDLVVTGVGGPKMRAQGLTGPVAMEDFEVMGFSDVLWALPRLWRQFNVIRNFILKKHPNIVIFIDSPSFSMRMARALRKNGYKGKIVQYVCPMIWAWGKHRIAELEAHFDLLLTIYPFERKFFSNSRLNVQYVGNPLQERIKHHTYDPNWQKLFGIKQTDNLIALFPGSRKAEIQRNLPKQLEATKLLQKEHPNASFAISCAHESNMELVQNILKASQVQHNRDVFFIPREYSYDLMRSCRSAIAKSGTVTLELALHQCPTVVVYELTALNRFIAKYILRVKLPHYCIVNILTEKTVYPELIKNGFSSQNLYQNLKHLHEDGPKRIDCMAGCKEVAGILPEIDASSRAAKAIFELV